MRGSQSGSAGAGAVNMVVQALLVCAAICAAGARGSAVDPIAAVAKFLGVQPQQVSVARPAQLVQPVAGRRVWTLCVDYPAPAGKTTARAYFELDPVTGTVTHVLWLDAPEAVGVPERSLPLARLQEIAMGFAKAHNPLPCTRLRLERSRPFVPAREYVFDWALVREGDAFASGRVSVTVRCADGKVVSYSYCPVDTQALRRAKVRRDQALRIAAGQTPRLEEGQQLQLRDAVLLDRWPYGPEGRPAWVVGYCIVSPRTTRGSRPVVVPWMVVIDAIDGRVLYKDR